MNSTHATLQSKDFSRAIEVEVYGDAGQPVIVLPEGDSSFASWSEGGMVDALAPLVDSGMMRLVCTDSVDLMGWYSRYAVPEYRLSNIKNFFKFVEKDLLPFVAATCEDDRPPVLAGAGMGALNACVLMLSRPQLFGGLLALSGTYDARRFVVGELPDGWEDVSPVDMVPALPQRGKAVRLLNGLPLAFVCGQDASEDGIDTQRALEQAFSDRGIDATFEYWGYDVRHDWEWWRKEAAEMLPAVLSPEGLADRRLSASLAYAEREAKHAAAQLHGRAGAPRRCARRAQDREARSGRHHQACKAGGEERDRVRRGRGGAREGRPHRMGGARPRGKAPARCGVRGKRGPGQGRCRHEVPPRRGVDPGRGARGGLGGQGQQRGRTGVRHGVRGGGRVCHQGGCPCAGAPEEDPGPHRGGARQGEGRGGACARARAEACRKEACRQEVPVNPEVSCNQGANGL